MKMLTYNGKPQVQSAIEARAKNARHDKPKLLGTKYSADMPEPDSDVRFDYELHGARSDIRVFAVACAIGVVGLAIIALILF